VTWTKVSLNEANMRATPKTFSPESRGQLHPELYIVLVERCAPSRTWGPREIFSVAGRSTFFFGGIVASVFGKISQRLVVVVADRYDSLCTVDEVVEIPMWDACWRLACQDSHIDLGKLS
jgi:hypothetical protein